MTHAGKLDKSFSSGSVWPRRHITYITVSVLSLFMLIWGGKRMVDRENRVQIRQQSFV